MATADAFPFRTIASPVRFAIALAAVALVYAADYAAGSLIDDGSLFLLLGMAVMASAFLAGTGAALAATVAGAVVGVWHPADAAGDPRATETHLALFVLQGLLLTALVAELRAARRTAEQRARDANDARRETEAAARMKEEFLATVSHELRTPLNAVLGWVHLLRTGKLDQPTAGRGLESIERNVRLQAQLTADLLDVSKALTGTLRLDPQSMSLTSAVRAAAMTALPAARAKDVRVVTNLPDESLTVLADPIRLRQIIWHLLANAVKFTPHGGTVQLDVEGTPDHVVLTVADSGPGIAPQFLPRIFDRFTQQDSSTTRTAGGLGIGLSLVRELVQMHGGEVHARNRDNEAGAIFTVKLPRRRTEPAPARQAALVAPAQASPPLDGVRVLVLDRDADGRELLRTVLQGCGATVRTVDSVADALEALEGWRPDALVTDTASPDHDSYALVGRVRWLEAERGGRIPAAALTTYARSDERVRQMLDTVQRDLPKPVEPSVLATEIARLTGRERRRVERAH
jgi:signal transduction histidine kinase